MLPGLKYLGYPEPTSCQYDDIGRLDTVVATIHRFYYLPAIIFRFNNLNEKHS